MKIFVFELKENDEHRPPNWKTRVEWNETETKIVSEKQLRKATAITNSIRISNNLDQYNVYSNFWSTLTGLVEEPDDNTYYNFSHVLQNISSAEKPYAKKITTSPSIIPSNGRSAGNG